jgi:hypothetical protein
MVHFRRSRATTGSVHRNDAETGGGRHRNGAQVGEAHRTVVCQSLKPEKSVLVFN